MIHSLPEPFQLPLFSETLLMDYLPLPNLNVIVSQGLGAQRPSPLTQPWNTFEGRSHFHSCTRGWLWLQRDFAAALLLPLPSPAFISLPCAYSNHSLAH